MSEEVRAPAAASGVTALSSASPIEPTGAEPKYTWVALAKDDKKGPPWNYYVLDPDGREVALCQMPDGETHAEQIVDALNGEDDKFNLRWNANMRAIKRWQDATGRRLTWPDHTDLVVWLLEQLEPASVDTRRQAETGTGSGRSPSGAVPAQPGDAQPLDPTTDDLRQGRG